MSRSIIHYGNVMSAAPHPQSKQLKRSNTAHFRLMKEAKNPDMKWYHEKVLNMQNVQKRVLTRKEREKLFEFSKRKLKPEVNYWKGL